MKTVLERATGTLLELIEGKALWRLTEPAEEGCPFEGLLRGHGGVLGECAAEHEDVHFAVMVSLYVRFLPGASL